MLARIGVKNDFRLIMVAFRMKRSRYIISFEFGVQNLLSVTVISDDSATPDISCLHGHRNSAIRKRRFSFFFRYNAVRLLLCGQQCPAFVRKFSIPRRTAADAVFSVCLNNSQLIPSCKLYSVFSNHYFTHKQFSFYLPIYVKSIIEGFMLTTEINLFFAEFLI